MFAYTSKLIYEFVEYVKKKKKKINKSGWLLKLTIFDNVIFSGND